MPKRWTSTIRRNAPGKLYGSERPVAASCRERRERHLLQDEERHDRHDVSQVFALDLGEARVVAEHAGYDDCGEGREGQHGDCGAAPDSRRVVN
jgi:hypothetical protein